MISLDLKTDWAESVVPVRLEAEEAISRCYSVVLDVLSHRGSLDPRSALNAAATVTLELGSDTRRIAGVVEAMSLMGRLPGDLFWYRLTIVPRLRLLGLTSRSRVFCTEKPTKLAELIGDVLTGAEGVTLAASDFALDLKETSYPALDMAVQYAESDLDFLARRTEYAGVFWFFAMPQSAEQVVFGDANACFPYLSGSAAGSVLPYRPSTGIADPGPAIRSAQFDAVLAPARVTLNERDFLNTGTLLLVNGGGNGGVGLQAWHEVDDYVDAGWGRTLATIRAEEAKAEAVVLAGESDSVLMEAGRVFTLDGHDAPALDGRYVVCSVRHSAWELTTGVEFLPGPRPHGVGYTNSFRAIPFATPYRPARATRWPRIAGLIRAVIDGVGTVRSDVDPDGCYRIIFPFDQVTRPPGRASRPVRLLTPYGGPSEGFHFPLRARTQVMIAFHNGDPDRPVIVGPLYDSSQKSVVTRQNRYTNAISTTAGIVLKLRDGRPDGTDSGS